MNKDIMNELERWWEADSEVGSFDLSLSDLHTLIGGTFDLEIYFNDNWGI